MMISDGFSKKLLNYITAISTTTAMIISISTAVKENKDKQARSDVEKAKVGFSNHSQTLEEMSKDIQENRRLLLSLYDRELNKKDNSSGRTKKKKIRLTPPEELFKNVPKKIPRRIQKKWSEL